jgi:hypothetical protein
MLITTQQETREFTRVKLKSDVSDPEYWQSYRALAGSPFESSDSDSSSDGDDDAMSLGSSDLFSNDVSLVSEGITTLDINALGLVFMAKEDVFTTEAVATLAQQAEGLRAPRYHPGGRSCDRPNQKHHAQQEYMAFQSDGPTDETLVRRFPQDIGLWAAVSDDTDPKVSKRNREAIPADRKDVSFSGVPRSERVPFRESSLVW